MKFARCLLGAFGFSTFHLHNNLPLNPQALSKVIPEIKSSDLLAQVEKQFGEIENKIKFTIVHFSKDDDFPPYISNTKNHKTWTLAPRSITATRKPRHMQSMNRRR